MMRDRQKGAVVTPQAAIAVVAAVNDETIFANNLERSPLLDRGHAAMYAERSCLSASVAYNRGLDRASADLIVFAHQDVYLPASWEDALITSIRQVEATFDANWAVLGVFGMTAHRQHVGRVWSSGLRRELVGLSGPLAVVSIDELVIVLRRDSGLRFDERLPGFHLYGTDIVQSALVRGFGAYAINAPVIHNSRPVRRLDHHFQNAHRYMRRKWAQRLPIPTCVVPLTRTSWPIWKSRLKSAQHTFRGLQISEQRAPDPRAVAVTLGYEEGST